MEVELTKDAMTMLSLRKWKSEDIHPVVQVHDLHVVQSSSSSVSGAERYRLVLSDGSFLQQGMLDTRLNDLVSSQKLQQGSVIRMTRYTPNAIRDRVIIVIYKLDMICERYDAIGDPKKLWTLTPGNEPPTSISATHMQSINQPATTMGSPQTVTGVSFAGSVPRPISANFPQQDHGAGLHSYDDSSSDHPESGRYNMTHAPFMHSRVDSVTAISHPSANSYMRPVQPTHNQPPPMYSRVDSVTAISRPTANSYMLPVQPTHHQRPPMYMNRGPMAKNDAPSRIIPIAALNPYQGMWTVKARVTAKAELRHYNNVKGDGKVFSFDLLDSDGGEIRSTCFNAVADQFYEQVQVGKVYYISKGNVKPAQKAYNHLKNDHEIMLDSTSTVQLCFDDDPTIPQQQFHFRPIAEIEGLDNNSILDIIGVVSSITPPSSIMRKNGTETQKRTLHLKDMSGRSVEVTLWGNFCSAEGQALQNMCDSGVFPVLAMKAARVSEFNGKTVGTISTSQLCIEPDFPDACKLKAWFDTIGRNTPSVSLSRDTIARTDVRKTISQIKDEKLGTSEKPDWITVSATIINVKDENVCYTACAIIIGDRQCNKKVTNNGDGKWRCDRCDQTVDQCDYRYILQLQLQDHTGTIWTTAFQESGEEIMGVSAKDLYYMKYEEQDGERFSETIRSVRSTRCSFKLKVKEETYNDEQRVKSTVVRAEKIKFSSDTSFLLDLIKKEDQNSIGPKSEIPVLGSRPVTNPVLEQSASFTNYRGAITGAVQQVSLPANQMGHNGSQYGGTRLGTSCNSCGGVDHISTNCLSVVNAQGYTSGGKFNSVPSGGKFNSMSSGTGTAATSGECYKCHQTGHWARDCPGVSNVPLGYGGSNVVASGRYGSASGQYFGGY